MDAQTIRRAIADFFTFNRKDFTVSGSPTGYQVSLLASKNGQSEPEFRLQLLNTSDNSDPMAPVASYRVRLGYVAGFIADSGMTDPGDDPIFEVTIPTPDDGWYVAYCKLLMTYLGGGLWGVAAGTVFTGMVDTPLPANDDGYIYIEIGQVRVSSGLIVEIPTAQAARGDMAVLRRGSSTVYVDKVWNTVAA